MNWKISLENGVAVCTPTEDLARDIGEKSYELHKQIMETEENLLIQNLPTPSLEKLERMILAELARRRGKQ